MQNRKLTIFAGAVLAGLLLVLMIFRLSSKTYTVQDFTGKTKQEIVTWMTDSQIPSEKAVFNYAYSDTVPENTVISQSIKAGNKIPDRSAVTFTISKGEDPDKKIILADFTGMNREQIEQWLKENGFSDYSFVTEISEDEEEGLFLYSEPDAGTRIPKDEPILITMCEHDHSTTAAFPDFTGQTVTEIQEWGEKNNITVNYIYYTNEAPYGSYLYADIPVGTEIEKGGYVSVAVSAGNGG